MTGKAPGDIGQPTFVGNNEQARSRPDASWYQEHCAQALHTEFVEAPWLPIDHLCHENTRTFDVNMHLHHNPVHGIEAHSQRWNPDRIADYLAYLEQDTPTRQKLYRAIDNEFVEQAWTCITSWIFDAA